MDEQSKMSKNEPTCDATGCFHSHCLLFPPVVAGYKIGVCWKAVIWYCLGKAIQVRGYFCFL